MAKSKRKQLSPEEAKAIVHAAKAASLSFNSLGQTEYGRFFLRLIEEIAGIEPDRDLARAIGVMEKLNGFNHSAVRQELCRVVWDKEPEQVNQAEDYADRYLS